VLLLAKTFELVKMHGKTTIKIKLCVSSDLVICLVATGQIGVTLFTNLVPCQYRLQQSVQVPHFLMLE
jgi:hypothetical protein